MKAQKNETALLINEEIKTIKEITTESNGFITLNNPEKTREALQELANKFQGFTITEEDIKDPEKRREKLEEAKEFRAEVRQPRYDLQNLLKHNKKVINQTKKDMESQVEEFIGILESTEKMIDDGVKRMEEQIKYEREEKKRKEEEERNRINNLILEWSNKLPQLYENCISIRNSENFISALDEMKKQMDGEDFGEFLFKAEEIYYRYESKVEGLNERIQKAKDQDEKDKKEEEERKKATEDRWNNYTILLDTIEALEGDRILFEITGEGPTYWIPDEKFELVRNEIQRLKNPEKIEPEDEEKKTAMKVNEDFDSEKHDVKDMGITAQQAADNVSNAFKESQSQEQTKEQTEEVETENVDPGREKELQFLENIKNVVGIKDFIAMGLTDGSSMKAQAVVKLEQPRFEFSQNDDGTVTLVFVGNIVKKILH